MKSLLIFLFSFVICQLSAAQNNASILQGRAPEINVSFNEKKTYQTIRNFSASDAWAAQFVGNWPDAKRNAVADWLFSMDSLPDGSARGIGLSMWRFNIGAGSAAQGRESGIRDEWRRAAEFNATADKKVEAQTWLLQAAQKRGVNQFLAFYNSPPIRFTKNGKAFASGGKSNIDSSRYEDFARYTVDFIRQMKSTRNINFGYISPVNEPQWDWSDGGQEGCPYTNAELYALTKTFDRIFRKERVSSKLLITESGSLTYLLRDGDKPNRGDQINQFFRPGSALYLGNLKSVQKSIASHSYFTTSPYERGVALRREIKNRIDSIGQLEYWQSEYCILGDNAGEINGNKKDLGINAAIYVAKVIHSDLSEGDAAAWHWWTAISAYDYKDGLVYIDKKTDDGNVADSKILWALGNYSRFIRPGMKRIETNLPVSKEIFASAYYNKASKEIVSVFINAGDKEQPLDLEGRFKLLNYFVTDSTRSLTKHAATGNTLILPARSIVTVILKR